MFIIFSGHNERAIIAFIRSLERYSTDYQIIARSPDDKILKTKYAKKVAHIRKTPALTKEAITTALDSLLLPHNQEHILAPSTEALNRFFLDNPTILKNKNIKLPLAHKDLYCQISDKKTFGNLCSLYKINTPQEIDSPEICHLPFVAKPISYSVGTALDPIIALSEADRRSILISKYFNNYYFQEYIDGRSFYLLLYISSSGRVYKFSQENLVQQPQGKSIIAAIPSEFHLTSESDRYIGMLKAVGFYGLIMIEVKQRGKEYFMIEANPRFWGPSQLFVDCMKSEDLFDAFLTDMGIKQLCQKNATSQNERYFWYEGILKVMRMKKNPVFYNYSPSELADELPSWLQSDIYRRPDTIEIFVDNTLLGEL